MPNRAGSRPAFLMSFFFQAEAGIRAPPVTGVQTCALPISRRAEPAVADVGHVAQQQALPAGALDRDRLDEIGRASCRERGEIPVVGGSWKKKSTVVPARTSVLGYGLHSATTTMIRSDGRPP